MTDNDIKKALECCSKKDCKQCPCFDENIECGENLIKTALDLINRQQAEIERLKAEIAETNKADREAEVQALSESKENAKLFCEAIKHAKSEAIKEFAERLKAKGDRYAWVVGISKDEINNLVKEMTEGNG